MEIDYKPLQEHSIDTDEWYPVYVPEPYEGYAKSMNRPKFYIDPALLERWNACIREFYELQGIFERLKAGQNER